VNDTLITNDCNIRLGGVYSCDEQDQLQDGSDETEGQLGESIHRFQESFWGKKKADRPPVGIYDERVFMPINFLRRPFSRATVNPKDLTAIW